MESNPQSVGLVGQVLNKALSALPFNGEKTKLALWVAALAFVQTMTGIDFGLGVDPSIVLPVSLAAAGVFILQRTLKGKLGLDKYGDKKSISGWGGAL